MTQVTPRPVRVQLFPSGELGIVWSDDTEQFIPGRLLREACPCAECVDELSGARRLNPARLPEDVRPVEWSPVGSYALGLLFSDGHRTGIYTFQRLRRIAGIAD